MSDQNEKIASFLRAVENNKHTVAQILNVLAGGCLILCVLTGVAGFILFTAVGIILICLGTYVTEHLQNNKYLKNEGDKS